MNIRIKQVRNDAGETQQNFANAIGISKSSVVKLESGENNPSEQTVRAICKEYNVSRKWLETGEGPMYIPEAEDDELIDEVLKDDDGFVRAVIRGIAQTPGGWEKMREVFTAIAEELEQQKKPEG